MNFVEEKLAGEMLDVILAIYKAFEDTNTKFNLELFKFCYTNAIRQINSFSSFDPVYNPYGFVLNLTKKYLSNFRKSFN